MCDRFFPISQPCLLHSLVLCFSACQQSNRDKSVHMPSSSCLGECRKELPALLSWGFFGAVRTWTHTGIFLSDYDWHRQSICLCFLFWIGGVFYDNTRTV